MLASKVTVALQRQREMRLQRSLMVRALFRDSLMLGPDTSVQAHMLAQQQAAFLAEQSWLRRESRRMTVFGSHSETSQRPEL